MSFVGVIGVSCVDILYGGLPRVPALGEEVYCREFSVQIGGSNATVATRMGELGANVRFGTFLGPQTDCMSNIARDYLKDRGVQLENFYHGSKSPVMVTSIASFPEDRYFLTRDSEVDITAELGSEDIYRFLHGARCALAMHGHDETYRRLKNEGTVIAYDVGWSDSLCLENIKDTLAAVSVFTPNDKEARKMTGIDNIHKALKEIARFTEQVIITCGAGGCITQIDGTVYRVPVCRGLKPVDFTGAGDNFMAGLLFGFFKGWNLTECMKFATCIGGISTTALGCTAAPVSLAKAMELMADIRVCRG